MIVSKAFPASTSSATLLEAKSGRKYVAVQNHDTSNSVCVTFGGENAVISTPNGMVIKAEEFGEIIGNLSGKLTIISETSAVNTTLFSD